MNFFNIYLILLCTAHMALSRYEDQHRPCFFNSLCTCSNGGPDLGTVTCYNVPFTTILPQIKLSDIYIMNLKNNKLRVLEDYSLVGTELWKLQINDNLLTYLPEKALAGLEKTLSILDLSNNKLVQIPIEAMAKLEKLQILNLGGNRISFVQANVFEFGKNLKMLDLSRNSFNHIHDDAFRSMESLEILNLALNSIIEIDEMFRNEFDSLKTINLMGNQLQRIPFKALAKLRNIKVINLSKNLISSISYDSKVHITSWLEELHLEYNLLQKLSVTSFQNFYHLNKLYLKGNPLTVIDGFSNINIKEIDMSDCLISKIKDKAFQKLEDSLEVLDLSFNNLTLFPKTPFKKLVRLNLKGNKVVIFEAEEIKSYGHSLKFMEVSGPGMVDFPTTMLEYLPNIRYLSFNKKHGGIISKEDFKSIGPTFEELHLVRNSINIIENGAFSHLSALKLIDLSYNNIINIGNNSFKDIGHSLQKLVLHRALSMTDFPANTLKYLSKLEYLDISSNQLTYLPMESFNSFQSLKYLNLDHNDIKDLNAKHMNVKNNPSILNFKIAFNKIRIIDTNIFNRLKSLKYVQLNDNLIVSVKKAAFVDLNSLISINLEGNNIKYIEKEAFQNLPKIRLINLEHNKLANFDLEAFDQVGRLSTLTINVGHNKIQTLSGNYTSDHISSNIKIMNFNHNNISHLEDNYFDPVRNTLNALDLSYNKIENLTNSALTEMTHLQILSISHNKIAELKENVLQGLKHLQILNMSQNNISVLPEKLFNELKNLRIIDASENSIQNLENKIFKNTILEQLDFSNNQLEYFPEESLLHVNETLQYLDISKNRIDFLNSSHMQYLRNLKQLSISNNLLETLDAGIINQQSKLIILDLSNNHFNAFPDSLFKNIPRSLESINLSNTSLTSIPQIYGPELLSLNISHNAIQVIHPEELRNLSNIQTLDFSNNKLTITYNNAWNNLHQLRTLHLSNNPIKSITNDSFTNLKMLQELFIKNLKLSYLHPNAFLPLKSLRKLEMNTYPNTHNINVAQMLSQNNVIKEIHLHVQQNKFSDILKGDMPKSLNTLVLEGNQLKEIDDMAFVGIKSNDFILDIHNTYATRLSGKLFTNMQYVQNFTILLKNNQLTTVGRIPFTSETEVLEKKLKQLELSGNELHCDCNFYWTWEWLNEYEYQQGCKEMICDVDILRNLRETKCINKNNDSIIDFFKTDLDCFSVGCSIVTSTKWATLGTIIILFLTHMM